MNKYIPKLLKGILFSALLLFVFISVEKCQAEDKSTNPKYDSTLANKLGADDYGMKKYVFVILKTGSNKIDDKKVVDSLFAGHMKNINRLADLGKLVVAGPFVKNDKSFRGLFILNTNSLDEAKELLNTDPAIEAKLLEPEMFLWYGSAALPMYLDFHNKIEKKTF